MALTFNWIKQTGLTQDEVLMRARAHQASMRRGGFDSSLQEAVDAVIDAAIEHAQG